MAGRTMLAMLLLVVLCGVCQGAERWSNFAEDQELKYYIDQRTIIPLPDNVFIFWVKAVAKDRDYFRREFNLTGASYMLTSYELDCAVSSYRVRGTIIYDKNRREVSKVIPEGEPAFEPVPPESVQELAQEEICKDEGREEETRAAQPAAPAASAATAPVELPAAQVPPEVPAAPPAPAAPAVPESPAAPAVPEIPLAPLAPAVPEVPAAPAVPTAPALPGEPPTLQ